MTPATPERSRFPDAVARAFGDARLLRTLTARQWLVAAVGAAVVGLVTGLPTDVVPNPLYQRMTPVLWWDYPVWAATAVLAGLVTATYVRAVPVERSAAASVSGGLLSFFAIGCPICNKLVVALLGVGGALSFFAPVQPYLAAAGLALLGVSLLVRLRELGRCAIPLAGEPTASAEVAEPRATS